MALPDRQASRIVVVDDHGLLAQSLAFALGDRGFDAKVCVDLAPEGVVAAASDPPAALVLLDLDLGHGAGSSVALIPQLADHDVSVLMITGVTDRRRLAECVEAGAVGVVAKSRPFDAVLADVVRAIERGSIFGPGEREQYLDDLRRERSRQRTDLAPFERLTPREQHVLDALLEGASADQIAADAVVSVATVRSQIFSMMQKLGVNSQLSAVALARRVGWGHSAD